ncbi:MAG: knotted carbamoyltransferase YgeW [Candidatus Wallbacteria bacterium HGW-Wallbacteria-1]|jgi:knotted carbamoyltransferase YgeW|uniref:Knotted carbamoyltransferase YgeW n=1 Tax=Candidatus Wallbacteria bacterium HGW-Wallbacteria-1 TaxID=2013854 RepID=A0A2N1PJE3_9BACT|nr:MAG: knotted carbamoyltransferase YgeW [Candidatus Wallbacteria bacterium HGW-Wallbacteria-1]
MTLESISRNIRELYDIDHRMFGSDFLLTFEKSTDDLIAIIKMAEVLREMHANNMDCQVFKSGLAISQFRDNSTRTRFSFASAANLLGLALQDFDEGKSQISHGETVRETANMISFLSDVIGIRDDMYIGKGHTYMLEVGKALDEGYREGVLPQRPAIVNLQCDIDHPTQSMADLCHLRNYFGGSLENLKGKKIAMTWAYSPSYGKPLSVPQGIITLMTRFGMDVTLAHPEGYDLMEDTIRIAGENARVSGGSFKTVNSMEEAFKGADIVYPKSWAPFHVMEERTILKGNNDEAGLRELEKKCLANNAKYKNWECDAEKMKLTKNGDALYMHCLPADITGVSCKEGEVSADVFEKYRVRTYIEARYKPFVIASMVLFSRFRDPVTMMDHLFRKGSHRHGVI